MTAQKRFPCLESAGDVPLICTNKMNELYGDTSPYEISKRLTDELRVIMQNNNDLIYMASKLLIDKASWNGWPTGTRGAVGSSFVAFLLGITEVNPLLPHYYCKSCRRVKFVSVVASGCDLPDKPCPKCGKLMTGDGHNIPFETFCGLNGEKEPDISLNTTTDMLTKSKEMLKEIFPRDIVVKPAWRDGEIYQLHPHNRWLVIPSKYADDAPIEYIGEDEQHICIPYEKIQELDHYDCYYSQCITNLSWLDALYKLSSETGVQLNSVLLNDRQVFEAVYVNGDTFGIPEFDNDFARRWLKAVKPKTFDDLVRIAGISNSTRFWAVGDTDAGILPSELHSLSEVITFRDDIMLYLIDKGVERAVAYEIMESVRKGKGVPVEFMNILARADIPDRYIESCNRIRYLFPKAHSVAYVMISLRLAWFKVHYPAEFQMVTGYEY